MLEHIVVGLDGSEASTAAANLAGWLAARLGSRLHLVAVVEEPPPYVSARREEQAERTAAGAFYAETLRTATARLQRRGLATDSAVRSGNEASGLLQAAHDVDADLIVIGHAGHSGVWGTGLGATAGRIVQAATTSVLVARREGGDINRLVVGYDGSPDATRAVELAAGIADRDGVSVTIAAPPALIAERDPRRSIEALRQRLGAREPWHVEALDGDPAAAFVRLAHDEAHDLLCVGAHGLRHPWAAGLGPVALAVLERAAGSVLVVRSAAEALTARRLMRARPVTVRPETPVHEAAERLLRLGVKSLPVADPAGRPVGIITLGDLLRRAGFGLRHSLAQVLDDGELKAGLAGLLAAGAGCATVMTTDPATTTAAAPVQDLLREMSRRRIKRLLVVDDDGTLIGIVSRSDVLRALAGATESRDLQVRRAVTGRVASDVMRPDVPAIEARSPAAAVARAVLGSEIGRVVVVDDARRPVGVIAARDLMPLATAATRAHLVGALLGQAGRLEAFLADIRHRPDEPPTAGDLMRSDVVTVAAGASLADVLRLMMSRALKRILVVDDTGSVVGVVDRADVVRALAGSMGAGTATSGTGWS